jgi:hypothetical protein
MWGPRPAFCYSHIVTVLSMWDALSEKRTSPSFTAVIVSSTCHLYLQFYMSAFYTVSQLPRTWFLVDTYSNVPCIQGLYKSRLGAADHALTHVPHVTTAA